MKKMYGFVLTWLLLIGVSAQASDSVKLKAVGASGGILIPQDKWNNGYLIEIQADIGEIMKYVFLIPHIGYWNTSRMQEGQDLSYSNLYFGTKFVGYFNAKPKGFFAGLGIQYHIINQDELDTGFDTAKAEINSHQTTRVGFSLMAGYLLRLKKVSFSIEPKYTVLSGIQNMMSVSLGANYLFP